MIMLKKQKQNKNNNHNNRMNDTSIVINYYSYWNSYGAIYLYTFNNLYISNSYFMIAAGWSVEGTISSTTQGTVSITGTTFTVWKIFLFFIQITLV